MQRGRKKETIPDCKHTQLLHILALLKYGVSL
jgi:hypothetical protein